MTAPKEPCPHCGTPMSTAFAYCPSCGRNRAGGGPVDRDAEHLNLLSIFYYVGAGLSALMGTFPLIHLLLGVLLLVSPATLDPAGRGGPPAAFAWFFILLASVMIGVGWTCAILQFKTARHLKARRSRAFCQVTAGITCLFFPLGTILGVFTLVVLGRPSVEGRFEGPPAA